MKTMPKLRLNLFLVCLMPMAILTLSNSVWRARADSASAQTITISPDTLPNPTFSATYAQQLTQTGGNGTITWSISEGTLPEGISLQSSTGILSGEPRATGTFNFTVKATDAAGMTGTKAYIWSINCPSLSITPTTFPMAKTGEFYSQLFNASTNTSINLLTERKAALVPAPPPTFKYSLIGTLPIGLTFFSYLTVAPGKAINGIRGTPAETGIFHFTIQAIPYGNTDTSCSTSQNYTLIVQEGSPLTQWAQIEDSQPCTGPGSIVTVMASVKNTTANSQLSSLQSTLNTSLLALPGTCTADVGACVILNASAVTWRGSLATGQTATIHYKAQVIDQALTGAAICARTQSVVGGNLAGDQTACKRITCPAIGPGMVPPAISEMSDQKAGSVLVYNLYTSSTDPTRQNTRINLTNSHSQLSAYVHLFFVAEGCSVADSYLCLTANQTASFLTSDLDPNTTGYLVAIAVDSQGCPTNFNYLSGDEYVKLASGHAANLSAPAFAAIAGGLPLCDATAVTATMAFDGISYNQIPQTLAVSSVGSRADGNDTLLIVNRIGGNLGTGAATLGTLFGVFYDDAETPLSFSLAGSCQLRGSLSNNFPRLTPRFESFIPAGRSGWLKLFSQEADVGILGSQINFNANAANVASAFNQGHNLHALTFSAANTLTIPVFPPNC